MMTLKLNPKIEKITIVDARTDEMYEVKYNDYGDIVLRKVRARSVSKLDVSDV
jgi:hypothetical protein